MATLTQGNLMKNKYRKYSALILGAVSGMVFIAAQQEARAELRDGVNKEIICKRPKTNERQLKIHSCQTMQYPLAPLAPTNIQPEPTPTPPYSS